MHMNTLRQVFVSSNDSILYGYVRQSLDICIPRYRLPKQFYFRLGWGHATSAFLCLQSFFLVVCSFVDLDALRFIGLPSHLYVLLASHSTIRSG